ncbi:MAG: carboxypeptidase regulatory-like domain-containing protein [Bacteroidia bacterium]|nr:carboxypeptidase regulatory-like domain-containing protein [Bacteroidia bacterium]
MEKINFKLLILLALTLVSSCRDDTETIQVHDEHKYTCTLKGLVLDELDNPVPGATIEYQGTLSVTDKFGFYVFENVKVNDKHNFLSVHKSGYFDGCRSFRAHNNMVLTHTTQLVRQNLSHSFASSTQTKITAGEVELDFPADAIVDEATGRPYHGDVRVAIHHIDPIELSSAIQMPGDLSALDENNELILLRSYGMVNVELRSPSGDRLQIKEGNTVTMTTQIPKELLSEAPDEIPMWHFNQDNGLWEKEGEAQREGGAYVAKVPHFSAWNYDDQEESVVVTGRVVDQDGKPLASTHILISAVNTSWGGHGNTDANGFFSGRVTRGALLNVSILGRCRGDKTVAAQIGPFDRDTEIENIRVNLADHGEMGLLVAGMLVDCNGEGLTEAVVRLNGRNMLVEGGELNVMLPYCSVRPSSISLVAFDRSTLKDTRKTFEVTANHMDLGSIMVCGEDEEFVEVKCSALNLDRFLTDDVKLHQNGPNAVKLQGYRWGGSPSDYCNFVFQSDTLREGTFPLSIATIRISQNNDDPGYPRLYRNGNYGTPQPGTITIVNNKAKSRWEGTYTATLVEYISEEVETFTGSFRMKY